MSAKLIRKKHRVRKRAAKSQLLISIFCDLSEHFCFPFLLFFLLLSLQPFPALLLQQRRDASHLVHLYLWNVRLYSANVCPLHSRPTLKWCSSKDAHLPNLDYVCIKQADLLIHFLSGGGFQTKTKTNMSDKCIFPPMCSLEKHNYSLSNNLYNSIITMLVWYNYCC